MAEWEVNDEPGKPADVTGDLIRRDDAIKAVKEYLIDTGSELELWDLDQVLSDLPPVRVDAAHIRAESLREAAQACGWDEKSKTAILALISTPAPSPDVGAQIADAVKAERAWWVKAIEAYFDATAVMDIEAHVTKARALASQEGGE